MLQKILKNIVRLLIILMLSCLDTICIASYITSKKFMKVATFDGPLNLEAIKAHKGVLCEGHEPYYSTKVDTDIVEHGTNIALTVSVNNPNVCVVAIKAFIPASNKDGWEYSPDYLDEKLVDADVYNFSLAGKGSSIVEKRYLLKALRAGKKVVVSAGNCEPKLKPPCSEAFYPAEYVFYPEFKDFVKSGMFVVVRPDTEYRNIRYDEVAKVRPYCSTFNGKKMCGSSMATAYYSGESL